MPPLFGLFLKAGNIFYSMPEWNKLYHNIFPYHYPRLYRRNTSVLYPYIEYKKKGMSQKQREMFQREIESYKEEEGRGGNDNLSREIIDLIVEMIMELFK